MNKYTAQVPIKIGQKDCMLEFDWRAISKLYSTFGPLALVNITRRPPDEVALFIHAGLAKHHPDIELDEIMDAGLPFIKTFEPIEAGIMYFYYGADGKPEVQDDDEPDTDATSKKN